MKNKTVCECRHLTKSYGRHRVLLDCNLYIKAGELVGLVGENGSGKSTLVRCLLGYLSPDGGTISMNGTIGYCPQQEILNRVLTLREHLSFARSIYQQHCEVDVNYQQRLVGEFRLDDYRDHVIGRLSGGTRQKLQFVTALLHRPALLLMDEPYEGFDWQMYLAFWNIVDELCQAGTGVLLITHFIYDRQRFNRVYHLKNGMLHEDQ